MAEKYTPEWLAESRKRIQEIKEGKRPNRTKDIMINKYVNACKQVGVKPNLRGDYK